MTSKYCDYTYTDLPKIRLKHMCSKEDHVETLRDAHLAAAALLKSETPKEFAEQWEELQINWADQHEWVTYMEREWVPHKERWAKAWRQVHKSIICPLLVLLLPDKLSSMHTMELKPRILLKAGIQTLKSTTLVGCENSVLNL